MKKEDLLRENAQLRQNINTMKSEYKRVDDHRADLMRQNRRIKLEAQLQVDVAEAARAQVLADNEDLSRLLAREQELLSYQEKCQGRLAQMSKELNDANRTIEALQKELAIKQPDRDLLNNLTRSVAVLEAEIEAQRQRDVLRATKTHDRQALISRHADVVTRSQESLQAALENFLKDLGASN